MLADAAALRLPTFPLAWGRNGFSFKEWDAAFIWLSLWDSGSWRGRDVGSGPIRLPMHRRLPELQSPPRVRLWQPSVRQSLLRPRLRQLARQRVRLTPRPAVLMFIHRSQRTQLFHTMILEACSLIQARSELDWRITTIINCMGVPAHQGESN